MSENKNKYSYVSENIKTLAIQELLSFLYFLYRD